MSGTRQKGRTPARAISLNPDGINVVVQRAAALAIDDTQLQTWVSTAMAGLSGEVTVRLVGPEEGASLNNRYRGSDQPTNVLAFPAEPLPMALADEYPPLGDLVLCVPVIAREAGEQGKSLDAHWAHMLVHGCLHLRGFDHVTPAGAEAMEAKEVNLMAVLGFADPYHER